MQRRGAVRAKSPAPSPAASAAGRPPRGCTLPARGADARRLASGCRGLYNPEQGEGAQGEREREQGPEEEASVAALQV